MSSKLNNASRRTRVWAPVALALGVMWVSGCAAHHVDWYAIFDARGELAALRESAYADLVNEETAAASAVLEQAEQALAAEQLDNVAQISQLALLRIEYAHAVGRTRAARNELRTATKALEAAALRADATRKELARAQVELRRVQSGE